jgi:hypothetical protein
VILVFSFDDPYGSSQDAVLNLPILEKQGWSGLRATQSEYCLPTLGSAERPSNFGVMGKLRPVIR